MPAGRRCSQARTAISPSRTATTTRALVESQGRKLLPTAIERSLAVEELRGECAHGHYYALTDRALQPGEFEHMLPAVIAVEKRLVSFTLLTHAVGHGECAAALELLCTACPVRAAPR